MSKKARNATESGKNLIQSVFGAAGVILVLLAINVLFSPQSWWFKYPAFFIGLGLIIQLFTYFGHKAAEKYEKRQIKKQKEELEDLELKQLEQEERNKRLNWDERDFV